MQEQQQAIIEHYLEAYNRFDVSAMLRDLHSDIVFENHGDGAVNLRLEGIDAFRQQAEVAATYFRERQQEAIDWKFDGERVLLEIAYDATLAVNLPNGLMPGDKLSMRGQSEFLFQEGKIIRLRDMS
ncbi:MAG: nuclear transport factor 2 family protein [Bacteroidota bacterium]